MLYDDVSNMIHGGTEAYPHEGLAKMNRRMTIREELNSQIAGLESMLKNKKAMVALLDENPVIEKFMDLSRQG